jgi:hypothetical protein
MERSTFMVDRRDLYAELRSAYYIGVLQRLYFLAAVFRQR